MSHNQIAVPKPTSNALATLSPEFVLWLARCEEIRDYPTSVGISIDPPCATDAMVLEAKARQSDCEAMLNGPSPEMLAGWMKLVSMVVRNPPSADTIPAMAKAYSIALSDVPAAVFTPESSKRAAKTFEFWPSAADIATLVRPEADAIIRNVRRIKNICRPEYKTSDQQRRDFVALNEEFERKEQQKRIDAAMVDAVRDWDWRQRDAADNTELTEESAFQIGSTLTPEQLRELRERNPLLKAAMDRAKSEPF